MRILVLCTANSCRSQMAHGYLQHFAGKQAEILSAGVRTDGVNPRAIAVMREDGIDISHHTSNKAAEYRDIPFDHVISVCDMARETCPVFPGHAVQHHHDFPDPAGVKGTEAEIMAAFRDVRKEIKTYCRDFVERHVLVL
jgi:arsenate reductase